MANNASELLHISCYVIGILLGALVCAFLLIIHYHRKLRLLEPGDEESVIDSYDEEESVKPATPSVAPPALMPRATKAEEAEERLFHDITRTIREEKLFLQPRFGRSDIVERFHITAHRAGMLFSKRQTSIPEFIRNCRLEYAEQMMIDQPQTSLADIATTSGFIHLGTFMHDFKDKNGVTPALFRETRLNSNSSNIKDNN